MKGVLPATLGPPAESGPSVLRQRSAAARDGLCIQGGRNYMEVFAKEPSSWLDGTDDDRARLQLEEQAVRRAVSAEDVRPVEAGIARPAAPIREGTDMRRDQATVWQPRIRQVVQR